MQGVRLLALAVLASLLFGVGPPLAAAASGTRAPSSGILVYHYQSGKTVASTLPIGLPSSSGKVTVLARDQDFPQPMTLSGGYVYWIDYNSGQVNRVPESGGKVQTLVTGANNSFGSGIAVGGRYVFWTYTDLSTFNYSLYRTDISTGRTKLLYYANSFAMGLGQIGTGDGRVFFLVETVLGSTYLYSIRFDGSHLTELADIDYPCPIEDTYLDGVVYWLGCLGEVGSVPAGGGAVKLLSSQLSSMGGWTSGVNQLVVVGDRVYWAANSYYNSSVDTVTTSGRGFKMLYSTDGNTGLMAGVAYHSGRVDFSFLYDNTSVVDSVSASGGHFERAVNYPASNLSVSGSELFLASPTDDTIAKTLLTSDASR